MNTCVIYARISVSTEESVSIERQIEAGQDLAKAKGWRVVGTFTDDGVSATKNKPEQRTGWKALLASPVKYDAVIIWKVDRLARRVIDFLHADETLRERKAGIVAVQDPVDMTTAQGRAFAQILAVFAEMESASMSARTTAARAHLIRTGRYVGGSVPYGYMSVPIDPDHPKLGWVIVHDPDRIDYVREIVERTLAGRTIYSTVAHLNETDVPTAKGGAWVYNTVEGLLRKPILAGLTSHNPGNLTRQRGADVLRGEDGLPIVDKRLAVMSVAKWRGMIKRLDDPTTRYNTPRAQRRTTSGVLSGLVWCRDCDRRMYRGTIGGNRRPGYYCKDCSQSISNFEPLVVDHFLATVGGKHRWSVVEEVHEGGSALLPEINERISELGVAYLNAKGARADELLAQMAQLKQRQAEAEALPGEVRIVPTRHEQSFGEDWDDAADDEARRAILGDALERIWVTRGARGGWDDASKLARLTFEWIDLFAQLDDYLPTPPEPSQEELAEWADYDPDPRPAKRPRRRAASARTT